MLPRLHDLGGGAGSQVWKSTDCGERSAGAGGFEEGDHIMAGTKGKKDEEVKLERQIAFGVGS